MVCPTCNFQYALGVKTIFHNDGTKTEYCDRCGNAKFEGEPDVYLGSKGGVQTEDNIRDPKSGEMIPFSSKREKAAAMKQAKVKQAPGSEWNKGYRRSYEGPAGRKTFFT